MNWLPDIGASTLALLMLVAFVAGMSRGFSGFGGALIFVPLAGALAGPRLAPPLLLVIDCIFASFLIPSAWGLGDWRDIGLMLAGAVVGVPAGAAILARFAPIGLRWLIAAMASAMLALLLSGWRYRGRPHAAATVAVGTISGLFSGIAQMGGSPVMSYWLSADVAHAKVRANVILYFAVASVLTLISYFWDGLMSIDIVKIALFAGPAYGVGTLAGSRMFRLASPAVFRGASMIVIGTSVLLSLPIFSS